MLVHIWGGLCSSLLSLVYSVLFWAVLRLYHCAGFFLVAVPRLLIAVASLVLKHRL